MSSIAEVAHHLDLSERHVKTLLDEGVIDRRERGAYSLDEARQQYVRHLREAAAGRVGGKAGADLATELTRLRAAQATSQEFRNLILNGQYVAIELVGAALERKYTIVRERMLSLPGALADRLSREQVSAVRREIYEALAELSDPERLAAEAAAEEAVLDADDSGPAPPEEKAPKRRRHVSARARK